jgi:hypothetical protein
LLLVDKEIRKNMLDYFNPEDLVDLLGITTDQLVDRFEDLIEEALDEILEEMHLGDDDDAFDSPE